MVCKLICLRLALLICYALQISPEVTAYNTTYLEINLLVIPLIIVVTSFFNILRTKVTGFCVQYELTVIYTTLFKSKCQQNFLKSIDFLE